MHISVIRQLCKDLIGYIEGVSLRRTFFVRSGVKLESGARVPSHLIGHIGKYTYIAKGVVLGPSFSGMGAFCSIGQDAIIGPNAHSLVGVTSSSMPLAYASADEYSSGCRKESYLIEKSHLNDNKVIIGNDVWVGARAIVLPGVSIGDGSVVGAGAIVTKDVEPYSLVAGNPARLIRYRFPTEVLDKLKILDVYSYDADLLMSVFSMYSNRDLVDFIDELSVHFSSVCKE